MEPEGDSTGEQTERCATNSSVQGAKGLCSYSSRGFHITSLPLLGAKPERKYDVIAVEQVIRKESQFRNKVRLRSKESSQGER